MSGHTQATIKIMTSNVLAAIQLCGFDIEYHEKKSNLILDSATFCKPNPKAFEILVHFLLSQIDAERSQKVFSKSCWPPILKEQQKEFKDIMFNWLLEITSLKQQKEIGGDAAKYQHMLCHIKFSNISKSLFMSPDGLKICELLFSLAQYVMLLGLLKLSNID